MRIEVIETAGALAALEPAWWTLWARCPAAEPFQAPAWLLPWWAAFGAGGALVTLAAFDGDALVALLPCCRLPDASDRMLLLGTGTSDRLDLLLAPDAPPALAGELVARLADFARDGGAVNGLDLQQLPGASPLLAAPAPAGWRDERAPHEPCPAAALPLAKRRMLERAAYHRRRLLREMGAAPERVTADAVLPTFAELRALHGARWRARGEPGVLDAPAVVRFHEAALPRLDARGLLRLYALRVDGRAIAVLYGLAAHGRAAYYIGGFDPAWGRHSPGTVLVAEAVEEAEREGARVFDFLRGAEGYKYRWGAVDRPTWRRRLICDAQAAASSSSRSSSLASSTPLANSWSR